MAFAAPWLLLALVPWAAVVLWLLVERPRRVRVPFLPLWRGPAAVPRQRSAMQRPPIWLAAAMAAMLLAVLAAARPIVRDGGSVGPVTVIVDRGVTMGTSARMHEAAAALAGELRGSGAVDLVLVPDGRVQRLDRGTWLEAVRRSEVTAADTTAAIESLVERRLRESSGAVLLISNRVVAKKHARLVQIVPAAVKQNVGIVALSARARPIPQVMVRIRNESERAEAMLSVMSGDQRVSQEAALPPHGEETAVFVNLPALGPTVSAALDVADDIPADDQAFLVRQRSWGRIEARVTLPGELQRMIDVYAVHRPPSEASVVVALVGDVSAASQSAAVIVPPVGAAATRPAGVSLRAHPVMQDVALEGAVGEVRLAAGAPAGDWEAIVEMDGRPAVCVREAPARQVWVGFSSESFARSPQFVVFWTNVLDWAGQGGEGYAAEQPRALGAGWLRRQGQGAADVEAGMWPGVWADQQGRMLAINAPAVRLSELAEGSDWRGRLRQVTGPQSEGRELTGIVLAAALAALALSGATWRRRGIRPSAVAA